MSIPKPKVIRPIGEKTVFSSLLLDVEGFYVSIGPRGVKITSFIPIAVAAKLTEGSKVMSFYWLVKQPITYKNLDEKTRKAYNKSFKIHNIYYSTKKGLPWEVIYEYIQTLANDVDLLFSKGTAVENRIINNLGVGHGNFCCISEETRKGNMKRRFIDLKEYGCPKYNDLVKEENMYKTRDGRIIHDPSMELEAFYPYVGKAINEMLKTNSNFRTEYFYRTVTKNTLMKS